jgi:hypothetical protein
MTLKQWLAQRKLARIVKAKRESFETKLYAKNRAAQLKRRRAGA